MLEHLRNFSLRSSRSSLLGRPVCARFLSFTSARLARHETDETKSEDDENEEFDDNEEAVVQAPTGYHGYIHWLEKTGKQYSHHDKPRNWLGRSRPFPLNTTFTPPTPVSNALRDFVYAQFMSDPNRHDVRALSERFGLSLKRVDAILRLKGLEASMKEGKPMQTGFLKGMERILGVSQEMRFGEGLGQGRDQLGFDATHADYQDEVEGKNEARHRYQRMFWEPVVEGQEPVLPSRLENSRLHAEKFAETAEGSKSDIKLLGRRTKVPVDHQHIHVVERPGRPSFKFVDVGGKFLDVHDRVRRMKEGERRVKLREKRRLKGSERAPLQSLTH